MAYNLSNILISLSSINHQLLNICYFNQTKSYLLLTNFVSIAWIGSCYSDICRLGWMEFGSNQQNRRDWFL